MFKGQGQSHDLQIKCCPLNIARMLQSFKQLLEKTFPSCLGHKIMGQGQAFRSIEILFYAKILIVVYIKIKQNGILLASDLF